MKKSVRYNVGIVGLGKIFARHHEAIVKNPENFSLAAVCDIDSVLAQSMSEKYGIPGYSSLDNLLKDETVNFLSICTPNYLHVPQALVALESGRDVLVEKPVALSYEAGQAFYKATEKYVDKLSCVLQVRYNSTVQLLREVLQHNLLGVIRSVSLVQRWQRPLQYLSGWRSQESLGGDVLDEVGIHYIDILQYLLGLPEIISAKSYITKHKDAGIADTVYALLDMKDYGGTLEISISSEPTNLECSLSIQGSAGFVKVGGKAMNIIEYAKFLSAGCQRQYEDLYKKYFFDIAPNSYGSHEGSCPNHPKLYEEIAAGRGIRLSEALKSIKIIDDIRKRC